MQREEGGRGKRTLSGNLPDFSQQRILIPVFAHRSKDYEVTLPYTDGRYAKFTVNGVSTSMIAVGGADVLADGSEIGVVKITYQNYAGGVQQVEFYLLASP